VKYSAAVVPVNRWRPWRVPLLGAYQCRGVTKQPCRWDDASYEIVPCTA